MNTTSNLLQIAGKILEIGTKTVIEISGNQWEKQEFVIETEEKYPKTINIHVWGDNVLYLQRCEIGDFIVANINIASKKSQDKWFTEVTAWKIIIDIERLKQSLKS
jgi:hypothetical protein